jgi:hypothetical protein
MSLISTWSTVANDNGTLGSTPYYWPEGQAPSTVNDCARLMMASIRSQWNDAQWFNWGYTVSRVSGNSFTVITASWNTVTVANVFATGGRVRIHDTAATLYGTITTVSVSAASVQVSFTPDSGSLTATASAVYNSIITADQKAIPSSSVPADVVRQSGAQIYGVDAGSTDAYSVTLTPTLTSYVAGQSFDIFCNSANTGAATLNIDGLGAKTIVNPNGTTLTDNEIIGGQIIHVVYDGTHFQMISSGSSGGGGGSGTVTSVGVSSSTGLQVANTPVTTTGTITVDLPSSISGRNMIVNGDFQVWQRGAGDSAVIAVPASTNAYTADRWQLSTNANQACTVTQTAGSTSGSYLATIQRNSGQTGTSNYSFVTSLTRSMCIGAAGKSVTLSFQAKKNADYSASADALVVRIVTGTGSSDSSLLNGWTGAANTDTTITLTSSLVAHTITLAVGASVTQMGIQFLCSPTGTAGTNDSYSLVDLQLEISPTATAFERLNFQQQFENCLPFYQKSADYGTAPQTSGSGNSIQITCSAASVLNNAYYATMQFNVPLFKAPTITTFPFTTYTNTNRWSDGGGTDYPANSGVVGVQGTKFFSIQNQSGGTLTIHGNQLVTGGYTVEAELT